MNAFVPPVQTSINETKFGLFNLPISYNTMILCGNITHTGGILGDRTEMGTTESAISIDGSDAIYIGLRARVPRESNEYWGCFGITLGY